MVTILLNIKKSELTSSLTDNVIIVIIPLFYYHAFCNINFRMGEDSLVKQRQQEDKVLFFLYIFEIVLRLLGMPTGS